MQNQSLNTSLYELSKYMQKLVKVEYPVELKYMDGNAIENWLV